MGPKLELRRYKQGNFRPREEPTLPLQESVHSLNASGHKPHVEKHRPLDKLSRATTERRLNREDAVPSTSASRQLVGNRSVPMLHSLSKSGISRTASTTKRLPLLERTPSVQEKRAISREILKKSVSQQKYVRRELRNNAKQQSSNQLPMLTKTRQINKTGNNGLSEPRNRKLLMASQQTKHKITAQYGSHKQNKSGSILPTPLIRASLPNVSVKTTLERGSALGHPNRMETRSLTKLPPLTPTPQLKDLGINNERLPSRGNTSAKILRIYSAKRSSKPNESESSTKLPIITRTPIIYESVSTGNFPLLGKHENFNTAQLTEHTSNPQRSDMNEEFGGSMHTSTGSQSIPSPTSTQSMNEPINVEEHLTSIRNPELHVPHITEQLNASHLNEDSECSPHFSHPTRTQSFDVPLDNEHIPQSGNPKHSVENEETEQTYSNGAAHLIKEITGHTYELPPVIGCHRINYSVDDPHLPFIGNPNHLIETQVPEYSDTLQLPQMNEEIESSEETPVVSQTLILSRSVDNEKHKLCLVPEITEQTYTNDAFIKKETQNIPHMNEESESSKPFPVVSQRQVNNIVDNKIHYNNFIRKETQKIPHMNEESESSKPFPVVSQRQVNNNIVDNKKHIPIYRHRNFIEENKIIKGKSSLRQKQSGTKETDSRNESAVEDLCWGRPSPRRVGRVSVKQQLARRRRAKKKALEEEEDDLGIWAGLPPVKPFPHWYFKARTTLGTRTFGDSRLRALVRGDRTQKW